MKPVQFTTSLQPDQRGFTLVEVLIAIGVFALGMVAVAAIFPTAMLIQQRTTHDVEAEFVTNNAKALLKADPFTYTYNAGTENQGGDLAGMAASNDVQALPSSLIGSSSGKWTAANRSYLADLYSDNRASYYWIPLVQNSTGLPEEPNWRVYAFIVRADERDAAEGNYNHTSTANDNDADAIPKVKSYSASRTGNRTISSSAPVGGGDFILTNNGYPYRVLKKEGNIITVNGIVPSGGNGVGAIWCSPRVDGRPSPAIGISVIPDGVDVTIN